MSFSYETAENTAPDQSSDHEESATAISNDSEERKNSDVADFWMHGTNRGGTNRAGNAESNPDLINDDILSATLMDSEDLGPSLRAVYRRGQEVKFMRNLSTFKSNKEKEVRQLCHDGFRDFVVSVDELVRVQSQVEELEGRLKSINSNVQQTGKQFNIAIGKQGKLESQFHRMEDTRTVLSDAVAVLDLLIQGNRAAELQQFDKALSAVRIMRRLRLRAVCNVPFGLYVERRVPALVSKLTSAAQDRLHQWLSEIRTKAKDVGKAAMGVVQARKQLDDGNSAGLTAEGIYNARLELDGAPPGSAVVEEAGITFGPFLQGISVYSELDKAKDWVDHYISQRRQQLNLDLPGPDNFSESYRDYLSHICGFFVLEQAVQSLYEGMPRHEVEALWEAAQSSIAPMLSRQFHRVESSSEFLQFRMYVSLFCATLEEHGYSTQSLSDSLESVRERYLTLLLEEAHEDVENAVQTNGFIPMIVNTEGEYQRLVHHKLHALCGASADDMFPRRLRFSESVPRIAKLVKSFIFDYFNFVKASSDVAYLVLKALDMFMFQNIVVELQEATEHKRPNNVPQLQVIIQVAANADVLCSFMGTLEAYALHLCNVPMTSHVRKAFEGASRSQLERLRRKCVESAFAMTLGKVDAVLAAADGLDWCPSSSPDACNFYIGELVALVQGSVEQVERVSLQSKDEMAQAMFKHISSYMMTMFSLPSVRKFNFHGIQLLSRDVSALESEADRIGTKDLRKILAKNRQFVQIFLNNQLDALADASRRKQAFPQLEAYQLISILDKYVDSKSMFRNTAGAEAPRRKAVEATIKRMRETIGSHFLKH